MEQGEILPSNPVDETQAPGSGQGYDEGSYHSSSDEDFDPNAVNPELNLSDSELEGAEEGDDTLRQTSKKRKRGQQRRHMNNADDKEPDFHNSGDETVVRRRWHKGHGYSDDEGGPGGLIKTRAQRAKECVLSRPSQYGSKSVAFAEADNFCHRIQEKKALPDASNVTVDVDALWATMRGSRSTTANHLSKPEQSNPAQGLRADSLANPESSTARAALAKGEAKNDQRDTRITTTDRDEMITIKRTYEFAGESVSEEKEVAKSSAEARLYLESIRREQEQQERQRQSAYQASNTRCNNGGGARSGGPPLRRPKKRISTLDPSAALLSTSNPSTGKGGVNSKKAANKKLTTIEKSKLDWAGFVDREGITDELDEHSRAKEGYLGRMDFLSRVQANRDEEARKARKIT